MIFPDVVLLVKLFEERKGRWKGKSAFKNQLIKFKHFENIISVTKGESYAED